MKSQSKAKWLSAKNGESAPAKATANAMAMAIMKWLMK